MDDTPLYQQIAESVRQEILYDRLQPGDRLPPVRAMARRWECTPGTVQRAYRVLARQGLLTTRPGQGTQVAVPLASTARQPIPLRQAALVHQAEAFLLEALSAGHELAAVEQAVRTALDRWRATLEAPSGPSQGALRFAGSHDPAISLIGERFPHLPADPPLQIKFVGSLGGLIALAQGEADLAGCHLWDEESDSYNEPFVRRILPGRQVALLTLAHRRLGLLVSPGNPLRIKGLADLARLEVRFVNRQRGAGTRVWLDAQLRRQGIQPQSIGGYAAEALTHSEVARQVAEGQANVGLGVEAAALAFGLGFVEQTTERYDLVLTAEGWETALLRALAAWLAGAEARAAIAGLGGYDTGETGAIRWLASR